MFIIKAASRREKEKNEPYLTFLAVAAVTFSNGGDNIGVYTPLVCPVLFRKPNFYHYNCFYGNDRCMVFSSVLPCKPSFDCFQN